MTLGDGISRVGRAALEDRALTRWRVGLAALSVLSLLLESSARDAFSPEMGVVFLCLILLVGLWTRFARSDWRDERRRRQGSEIEEEVQRELCRLQGRSPETRDEDGELQRLERRALLLEGVEIGLEVVPDGCD